MHRFHDVSQTEIGYFNDGRLMPRKQHVLRFQVPVDDAHAVDILDAFNVK